MGIKRIIPFTFAMLLSPIFAQQTEKSITLTGFVFEQSPGGTIEPLSGAHILCVEDQQGAVSDGVGAFSMQVTTPLPISLVASFVGYESDTLSVDAEGAI